MLRKPLNKIIERIPSIRSGKEIAYIQDTINLEESIRPENREDTVRLYYFAKTIKSVFEEILLAFSEPIGRGFWLTAEYGVGKSHFLATLACLLSDNSDQVWDCVHDADIKNYQFRYKKRRLFPVVAGLRGKTAKSEDRPITFLDQLEKEIEESISQLGLEEKINITAVAETVNLFDNLDPDLQGVIQNFIQQKSGIRASELRKNNPDQFADLVRRYFKKSNIFFEPKYSINERLLYLYQQIVNPDTGFNGLLFVIDEFEAWLAQRPIASKEGMFDSNVLQVLTEILPKQYNCEIFIVIASQTDIPAQLQGRLKRWPLLAGAGAERDYSVICAHRVRRYRPGMEPEAKLYYHNFYNEFSFYKSETEDSFLEIFPFHPLTYEIVRRFTSSVQDMPGVRLGLNILYDVMKSEQAMALDRPVTVNDTHENSVNLKNTLAGPRFSGIQKKYSDALSYLPKIFADEEDRSIAEAILTILYLQFVISGDQTVPMTITELVDGTITPTGAITGEQRILVILNDMAVKIPQIEFDSRNPDKGIRFIPKQAGPTPQQLLENIKQDFIKQEMEINSCWERLLFASPAQIKGQKALFGGFEPGRRQEDEVVVNQVTYKGEIIISFSWSPDLGAPIQDPDIHFRLIYLLHGDSFNNSDLKDPRIVVVKATPLNDRLRDFCSTFLAAEKLRDDFDPQKQKGPEAAHTRAFAEKECDDVLLKIIRYQLEPFQKGRVHTRDGINIDLMTAMSKPTSDQRNSLLIRPTLENAYQEFGNIVTPDKIEKPIVATDAKNLVLGFIQNDTAKAVKSTLDQKAVGLGFALPENPLKFNPQHSMLFRFLDDKLKQNPALLTWSLIKEMASPPYGVPPYLFGAVLLLYVRYRNVPSYGEIELKPQHNITTLSGQRLVSNRITRSNVTELRWISGIERNFDTLIAVSGPDWNSLQPYARILYPEAKVVTDPRDIDQQIAAFIKHLESLLPLMKSALENLEALGRSLSDPIPSENKELLEKFIQISSSQDLENFDSKRRLIPGDIQGFKEANEKINDLRDLSGKSIQIMPLFTALQEADTGKDNELDTLKQLLQARYKLSSMLGNPTALAGLLKDTEEFLKRYENARKIQGDRNLEKLKTLKTVLLESEKLLSALGQLNKIESLGPQQGGHLSSQFNEIHGAVDKEISGECGKHKELSYCPPENEVREIQQKIRQTFESRINILRGQIEKAIKEGAKGDHLKTLLELIQVSKLSEVAKNMTPAILETVKKVLRSMKTQVVRSRAIEELIERFAVLHEENIDSFLSELRSLLTKEFQENKQDDRKIALTFK